jgi:hypothetical protein
MFVTFSAKEEIMRISISQKILFSGNSIVIFSSCCIPPDSEA